ncbi:hypothetical protein DI53_1226 [Sphingobacterium deserti]|uniref:Uncharacterized protein n=1 Tax=Sphingobacterium deserti TaxID=1229276 RepID=A0A0B8T8L4_9SPHI|nr:hypothetical protein DI53_1226 [Sphingobacterium deserti]
MPKVIAGIVKFLLQRQAVFRILLRFQNSTADAKSIVQAFPSLLKTFSLKPFTFQVQFTQHTEKRAD